MTEYDKGLIYDVGANDGSDTAYQVLDALSLAGYPIRHFRDYFNHTKNKQLIFWVDIRAKY